MQALLIVGAALAGISVIYGQSAADALFVAPSGNVGIGSTSPTQKLDVAGTGWTEYTQAYGRFVRGIDKSRGRSDRSPGTIQQDALQNITGSVSGVSGAPQQAWPWDFHPGGAGAFSVTKTSDTFNGYGGHEYRPDGGAGDTATFDAARVARTADETRPKNVALRGAGNPACSRLSGGFLRIAEPQSQPFFPV